MFVQIRSESFWPYEREVHVRFDEGGADSLNLLCYIC
jgi:hypothetical protein